MMIFNHGTHISSSPVQILTADLRKDTPVKSVFQCNAGQCTVIYNPYKKQKPHQSTMYPLETIGETTRVDPPSQDMTTALIPDEQCKRMNLNRECTMMIRKQKMNTSLVGMLTDAQRQRMALNREREIHIRTQKMNKCTTSQVGLLTDEQHRRIALNRERAIQIRTKCMKNDIHKEETLESNHGNKPF
mmetsp:Transcript_13723/g.25807  ORF Transcript_13723/g.25807 Transcript_13723/m.25807 type:complete len:188 (+) Transcript_13723:693-1256(+)